MRKWVANGKTCNPTCRERENLEKTCAQMCQERGEVCYVTCVWCVWRGMVQREREKCSVQTKRGPETEACAEKWERSVEPEESV